MKTASMTIHISFAWWFHALYLPGMWAMIMLGGTPDPDKVEATVRRAIRIRIGEAHETASLIA